MTQSAKLGVMVEKLLPEYSTSWCTAKKLSGLRFQLAGFLGLETGGKRNMDFQALCLKLEWECNLQYTTQS